MWNGGMEPPRPNSLSNIGLQMLVWDVGLTQAQAQAQAQPNQYI
jgi:hypothetical protein